MNLKKEEIPNLPYDELVEHIRMSKINSDEYEGLAVPLKEELALREPTVDYSCPKCGHKKHEERQLRAAGGGFSALFDIQTERYRVISCARCKYSEIYHGEASIGEQVLDFMVGT